MRAVCAASVDEAPVDGALICPILDARRSQVYGGGYLAGLDADGAMQLQEAVKAGPYTIDEFMELAGEYDEIYMLGDGVDTCGQKIEANRTEGVAFAPEEIRYQRAEEVAVLGAAKFAAGESVSYDMLKPEYMRMAEAERKLRARFESRAGFFASTRDECLSPRVPFPLQRLRRRPTLGIGGRKGTWHP